MSYVRRGHSPLLPPRPLASLAASTVIPQAEPPAGALGLRDAVCHRSGQAEQTHPRRRQRGLPSIAVIASWRRRGRARSPMGGSTADGMPTSSQKA